MKSFPNYTKETKFNCNAQTKYLQNLLDTEMHGIERLPALLFDNPLTTLDDVGLDQYEILNNEPLHGISHHTQNLYDELPNHFPKKYKSLLKKLYSHRSMGKMQKTHVTTERVC